MRVAPARACSRCTHRRSGSRGRLRRLAYRACQHLRRRLRRRRGQVLSDASRRPGTGPVSLGLASALCLNNAAPAAVPSSLDTAITDALSSVASANATLLNVTAGLSAVHAAPPILATSAPSAAFGLASCSSLPLLTAPVTTVASTEGQVGAPQANMPQLRTAYATPVFALPPPAPDQPRPTRPTDYPG